MNPCQGWSTECIQSEILSSLFYYALLPIVIGAFLYGDFLAGFRSDTWSKLLITYHHQGRRMLCKSEGAQASNKRGNSHLPRGIWGHAPPGKFGIFDSQRVLLRPSGSSFEALFTV